MTTTPGPLDSSATALDFYALRREGVGWIQQAGSDDWTDYNLHDPGITILEALSFALTELAYRTEFPIADILASVASGTSPEDPYPDQAFFSARTILTVNPTTPDDLRRLLIDLAPVRNAWLVCKSRACEASYYAWCEDGALVLSHDPTGRPDSASTAVRVEPRGLSDVLLELEPHPDLGDLNNRTIVRRRVVSDAELRRHVVTVETTFPDWRLSRRDERGRLARDDNPIQVTASGPNRTKGGTTPVDDAELRANWGDVFYVDLTILLSDTTSIDIDNVAVRIFGSSGARDQMTVADLLAWLTDPRVDGFADPYRRKLALVDAGISTARTALERHRNLDEDVCRVELVEIVDIAVCADVEVEPGADLELVLARIWFEIQRALDPPVEFRALAELRARGVPVETIFNGPELDSGFITDEALTGSQIQAEIRVSDLLDRLADLEGVVSVERLRLTAYAGDGTAIPGISDPTWTDGTPVLDPERTTASWLMFLPARHRPRLHRRLSSFAFTQGGLPFVPRTDEAEDTLVQLLGRAARPKLLDTDLDLPVPVGARRDMRAYHPVQHSLPQTYGLGPAGLPSTAPPVRRAQAKQLKAYLMVFEQLLHDAYLQVARVGELFSLDDGIDHTYFTGLEGPSRVAGYEDVVAGLTSDALAEMSETRSVFVERRNRFLDHLLSRFAETFRDVALQLASSEGTAAARAALIDAKLAFLRALPELGHDRGRAFDRSAQLGDPATVSGLQRRVTLMLGLPEVTFSYRASKQAAAPGYVHALHVGATAEVVLDPPADVTAALTTLITDEDLDTLSDWGLTADDAGVVLTRVPQGQPSEDLTMAPDGAVADLVAALSGARQAALSSLTRPDHLVVGPLDAGDPFGPWRISVEDPLTGLTGVVDGDYPSERTAGDAAAEIAGAAAHARSVVVEHLLLRPKFPGDALHPACSDGDCCTCGDEDPYSFRLTFVVPGWTAPLSTDITMRRLAERTIQEQTPSHLLIKTCWVGNDGFVPDPCDPVVDRLAELLGDAVEDTDAACACAAEIYEAHAAAFRSWLAAHSLRVLPASVAAQALAELFATEVDLAGLSCADHIDDALRDQLWQLLVEHFAEVVGHGYQFERFHDVWSRWVRADAAVDWPEERLQETVVEELTRAVTTPGPTPDALCRCAATVLAGFGAAFRGWMESNIAAGREPGEFTPFAAPALAQCPDLTFDAGALNDLRELLTQRYDRYVEVSYRLDRLVHVLAGLRNTYPRATLHDCDAGSDVNPVRLGHSALGSN
ncbi:hypothetical protein [Nocardioides sp.]|uniref:hypothetical protein n=1 Tax=Nocardioides sp. TaxID=35761 RepID=UPI0035AF20D0